MIQRVLSGAVLGAVVVGSTLAACSGAEAPPPYDTVAPPVDAPRAEVVVADPVGIYIPAIGARSDLIPLGLNPDGSLEVPPVTDPLQAGWYAGADPAVDGDEHKPGDPTGPSVIAGHVDGVIDGVKGRPGIFYRLHKLVPGDDIHVELDNGVQLKFLVDRVERHTKDAFPSDAVYGPTRRPELRLITCGGAFDQASGHYLSNVVVFASLTSQ